MRALVRAFLSVAVLAFVADSLPVSAQQRQLDLPPAKIERLQQHANKTRTETLPVRRAMAAQRQALGGVYGRYSIDEKKAQELIREIGNLQRRLLDINHGNQVGLRRILTKQEYERFAGAMLRRQGGPGSGPRGRAEHEDGLDIAPIPGEIGRQGIECLRLAPNQVDRVKRQLAPMDTNRETLLRQLRQDTEAVRRIYLSYDMDDKQTRELLNRINSSQRRLLDNSLARQIELRKVLTEDQFNAVMQDVRRGMQRQHRPGPGRR